jgi:hypothetical protein
VDQLSNHTLEDCWVILIVHECVSLCCLYYFVCSNSPIRDSTHQHTMSMFK